MPKRVLSLVQWSKSEHAYELLDIQNSFRGEFTPESPAWFAWLESISSFAFRSRSGVHYTVRKEHVQRNGPYWYGYRSFHGKTVKRYVGRTADLSLALLEKVAERFTTIVPSPIDPSLSPSSRLPSTPLLVSRFHPPRLPLALVERPHLFAKLDAWRSHKLTLLWAPAGSGKTTLVNSWQRTRRDCRDISHIAWVSLEASANDPAQFWRSIMRACQTWQHEIGETALARLQQGPVLQPPLVSVPLELSLTLFLNDLADRVSDGILILDDYQEIVESSVHETLAFFIEHLPAYVHVMILTRIEPPLPLVRWRARGDLQELSLSDLRFSLEETAIFLQDATASVFSEQSIIQLDALLQGWVAGLRLLVLAGQMTQGGVERHLALLHERQHSNSFRRQLLDYFVSEVLASQPEPLQLFLLQTCELPRLAGPLCDAVTGRQNSTVLLETLERAGLFLEALDEAEAWYRPSPLFAEALRIEARRRLGEEALQAISRRASHWYEQHTLAGEAIEAALRAHDVERTGILIEYFGTMGQRYDLPMLRGWLEQLPDEVLDAHPVLCFYTAITLQFQGEQPPPPMVDGRIEALLQRAEKGWRSRGKLSWVGLVFAFRSLIASLQEPSPKAAVEHATKALPLLQASGPGDGADVRLAILEWRAICLGIVGSDAMHQGRFDEARQRLLEAHACSQEGANRQFLGEINVRLGAVCMALGELHQASEYYQQALALGRSQEKSEDSARALLGLAQLLFEWNDLEASEQRTNEVLELTQAVGQDGSEQRVAYLRALLCDARGQEMAAAFHLAALLARLQATSTQGAQELFIEALALQAHLQLAVDDHLAVQRSLTMLAHSTQELSFAHQMMVNILRARFQLAQGETNAAVSLLKRLLSLAQEKRHVRSQIELQILLALTQAARMQKDEARKWLREALSLARAGGFLRVFLDEGEALVHLLRSLLPGIREKTLRSYGQTILHALPRPAEASAFARSSDLDGLLLEPLSPQEQRVLRSLCAGRSNREIASELVVSVNTVKDHIKHLYQKLGVSSRLEAYQAVHHLDQF